MEKADGKRGLLVDSGVSLYEADLHCHTTASDGLFSPTELVRMAERLGLKALGITDHDTIQGWREAEEVGANCRILILRGVELSTDWDGKEVHILGYALDRTSDYLERKLQDLREAREKRVGKILSRLENLGIKLALEEVQKFVRGESVGRPHVAQALVEGGYVKDVKEGFDRFLGMGAPAYVPHFKLTPEEGIALIRKACGVAVLAHPGVLQLAEEIPAWIKAGLQGIEVSHSEHTPEDEKKYLSICREYDLLPTGGSDFHGEAFKAGVRLGGWGVSLDEVRKILALAERNALDG